VPASEAQAVDGAGARPPRPGRLLTFRSGGWVLLLAGLLSAGVLAWGLAGIWRAPRQRAPGDGRTVVSYGYDLRDLRVPGAYLVAAGFPKDGVPALTAPPVFNAAEVVAFADELRREHAGKFLVSGDRVIGVVLGGAARAYPLRLMNWHEVVNDTLGGVPIAVTYSPLCDSAVVFRRERAGQLREFGVSGLLYQSNLVMYDRQPNPAAESLWSQLGLAAIAGPAAGEVLPIVPAVVMPWGTWHAAHPDTSVLAPDRNRMALYKRSYDQYLANDELHFPVAPPADDDGRPRKAPVLALRLQGTAPDGAAAAWHVFALADILRQADAGGTWRTTLDGRGVTIQSTTHPPAAWVTSADDGVIGVPCLWFAWHALHP
jgi:hypothetical protein